jgi:HEAT repeat protein
MSDEDPYFLHLLQECRDPDRQRRMRALDILRKDYSELIKADVLLSLLHGATHYEEQVAILSMMSQLGPAAPLAELQAILLDRAASNEFPREYVASVLAALEENAPLDIFIRILQDPGEDIGLRECIASLLGQFGERVSLDVLLAAIADPEPGVCAAGIESLIEQGPRAPLEPILAQVTHPEWYVRKAAIRALSTARERAPIEPIVAALSDPDARVRDAAALGMDILLEWFGNRVPLPPLIAALGDEHASVRESALDALANHPECAPLEPVVQALDDQNPYVRCAALLVLERMGSSRVPETVYPKLVEMTATETHMNARKYATRTLLLLKGIFPGRVYDIPGEDFTAG